MAMLPLPPGDSIQREDAMAKVTRLFFAAAIMTAGVAQASAMPAQIMPVPGAPSSAIAIAACGPGTHLGRYGHYCWPNKVAKISPCPVGFHLGPHGEYCWPDGVASVPSHWTKACPPGYHLG